MAANNSSIVLQCLRSSAKGAVLGATVLGIAAFAYVAWDAYKFFERHGNLNTADAVSFTVLAIVGIGAVAGGLFGAAVGCAAGVVKALKEHAQRGVRPI
jgi:predicted PurR-regulated permease PerM